VLDVPRPGSKVLYRVFATDAIDTDQRNMDEPVADSEPLTTLELSKSKFYDNQWRTIGDLDLVNGRLADGRSVFQLVVDGVSGVGSNLFQVFISGEEKKNTVVPGVRLYSPAVNLQLPAAPAMDSEVRFTVPLQSEFLKITNLMPTQPGIMPESIFPARNEPRFRSRSRHTRQPAPLRSCCLMKKRGGLPLWSSLQPS
jgi:hypothetical protein